eukprot:SAG25_NODE_1001_length_4350_cov_1.862856_4_plen_70_part_00
MQPRGVLALSLLIFSGALEVMSEAKASVAHSQITIKSTRPAIEVRSGGLVDGACAYAALCVSSVVVCRV